MSTFPLSTARRRVRDRRAAPRWVVRAAYLAPAVTLPSGLWRLGLVFGLSMGAIPDNGEPMTVTGWETVYVLGLSVVAEATALLTIGLVRPWGERAPRWMPLIGGKAVPAWPVVAVATAGTLALAWIWGGVLLAYVDGQLQGQFSSPAWEALFVAAYAPLLLWAPLVGVVTFDFWRRRCRAGAARS